MQTDIQHFLNEKYDLYNREQFIVSDPILIPKQFTKKEDIEIAAFMSAAIAWGQRPTIIKNAVKLMDLMGNQPYEFLMQNDDFSMFADFKHRTFNGEDCIFFLKSLKNIYQNCDGLETVFTKGYQQNGSIKEALLYFRQQFFAIDYPERTQKHISNVAKKSAAKRLNMFLRWLVRNDNRGVDFGLWKQINPADLMLPLDVHTGNVSRKLGLLTRKQNDWQAVEEVTQNLRKFDASDPIKYDYALFGLGIFEGF